MTKRIKDSRFWIGGMIITLLIIGILYSWWSVNRADHAMREDLLQQAHLVTNSINIERLQALTGTAADLNTPGYLRLKEQLAVVKKANVRCRFTYLMGRNSDGRVFFFVDNEPVGSKDESPAGQIYEEISPEYLRVFDEKISVTVGPVTDRWGTWITALVPMIDPASGGLVSVMGMDIDASAWKWDMACRAALPVGLFFILLIGAGAVLLSSVRSVDVSPKPVMNRLLLPLVILILVLILVAGVFEWYQYQHHYTVTTTVLLSEISGDLNSALEINAAGLATALQPIVADKRMRTALLSGDTDRLLSDWQPVFEAMHKDNHITHFYFFDPTRTCLLRVHKPEKNGDLINRFTALEAERTGKTASGIELGPLGTFTLRVVQPVFQDNRLLGYVELGKEIEDILQDLHKRSNGHLALAIRKEHLDRETWEDGMKFLGREAIWDRMPGSVIIYSSQINLPDVFASMADHNPDGGHVHNKIMNVNLDGRKWSISAIPMRDVSGKEVGDLIIQIDITDSEAAFTRLLTLGGMVCLILLVLLVAIIFILLRRTDQAMVLQQTELQESEHRHRAMFQKNKAIQLLIDPGDGAIVDANSAACEFYGYALEQMRQMKISDINTLPPDTVAREMEAARLEQRQYFEFKHKLANGQIRDVEVTSSPILSGSRQWLYSIIHDISNRKRAEEKLKESETNFRTFFNSIDDFLFVLDEQGNIINVNETVSRRLAYSDNELVGRNVLMVHPEDRQAEAGRIVSEMLAGTADFCPVPLITKSGQLIQVETRVYTGSWNNKPALFGVTKDITKIKETEELFSKAFDAGASLMAISEIESGLFINVNKIFLDTLGYTRDEIIGKSSIDLDLFDNPEDRHKVQSMVKESGFVKNMEVTIRAKKGASRIGLFSVIPIEVGNKSCWLTSMTDITDRKQLENSLRERQSRLDLALQSAQMGAWSWNIIENKRYFDTKACHLLGIEPEKFCGTAEEFFSVVHLDDRKMLKDALARTIDQDVPYNPEYRVVWPDGSIHYILAHGKLHCDDSGQPVKIIGLVGDITKNKNDQQKLEDERHRLANVIQGTQAGIWEWNVQTGETVFNEKWAEIIGYSLEELAPVSIETWKSFAHPEDLQRSGELLEKHFSGELSYYDCQCRMKHKNGHWVWVHDRGQVITWTNDGKPLMMFGTHMDISQAKQAEKELVETNLQLESAMARANQMATEAELANIAKSEFLANMSHEIRTPMNGVIGMVGLLLDTELTSAQRHYAQTVRASGELLLGLLNDILDFSKIEAGKLDLEILDFDLQSLLDDFAATLAIQAHDKGIELLCGMSPDAPTLLRGDPGRLRQIMTNLTGNAIKFTHTGEVAIRVTLESEKEETALLRFSIRDTGIGIPSDKIGMLFNKFSQVDASTTRQFGGTGLGLAISKQLTEMMDGEIGVTSKENMGSEFWFTACLEKQSKAARSEVTVSPLDLKDVRVLIVDDNTTNREILSTSMTSWGMRVSETGDGPGALDSLYKALDENDPFQVAVIDMMMPGMDGAALGRAIKAEGRLATIRMVLLSSLGVRGDTKRFAEIGFNAYLTKPARSLELKAVILQVLASNDGEVLQPYAITTRHTARETVNLFSGYNVRILLVEDNFTNQQVAVGILMKLGLSADAVANGAESLKALESIPYDLVLMDVQMPVMDGYEATARIRSPQSGVRNHNIPVIAMTAHAMTGDREKCLEAGMNDYISKPINPNSLAEVLEKWLPTEKEIYKEVNAKPEKKASGNSEVVELTVWDKETMLERLMGDEDLARTIISGFIGDIPNQIQKLDQFIENGDIQGVERQAHTIKGAAANVGGDALHEIALAVEKAGNAGNLDAAGASMEELKKRFDCLAEEIRADLGLNE
ncbi:hypothetical protein JCM14469_18780 [Desulfatiferula olefinivorans]